MTWMLPAAIVLFVLAMHFSLEKSYAKWSRRMEEMERRNAELIERIREQRERRTGG